MSVIGQQLRLVVRTGALKGAAFEVPATQLTIGREAGCDLRFEDPKVSRLHAFVERRGERLIFRDNHSTNGSLVNGRPAEMRQLECGDVIQVGGAEIALLDVSDFDSISYIDAEPRVTAAVTMSSVGGDALAEKLTQIFEYYKNAPVAMSPVEQVELVRTQRMATSLQALYGAAQSMSRLLPQEQLLEVIARNLFEVFAGAENLVILTYDEEGQVFVPRLSRRRSGGEVERFVVSSTVLSRAAKDRSTLIANDVTEDVGLSASESLMSMRVKSVICAPLVVGDRILGALYMDNRQEQAQYDQMDAEVVTAFANQAAITLDNARLNDNLQQSYHQLLQALVRAIETKDSYTLGHSQRGKQYAVASAEVMQLDGAHVRKLAMAADLHDIGKIGVRERVINKPGALTGTEFDSIKLHVEMGERILKPLTFLRELLPWIRSHHERWDGSGYPDGLKGGEIPLEGRILAVADAFDAMTSQRPYNKPLTFDQGLARLKEAAGVQFDPDVVRAFERSLRSTVNRTVDPEEEGVLT